MKIICCYCQKAGRPCVIGEKPSPIWDAKAETHGICPACIKDQLAIAAILNAKAPATVAA